MIKPLLISAGCALLLLTGGCTAVKTKTAISSPLQGVYFNSIASRYMERPTTVEYYEMTDGKSGVIVQVAGYGPDYGRVVFSKAQVPDYLPLLDKYQEWADKAREREDIFTKVIGEAPSHFVTSGTLRFTFDSGNAYHHYLTLLECSLGVCFDENEVTLDAANVERLKALLLQLQAGELQSLDVDAQYQ